MQAMIKQLEAMGQSASLKQYSSIKDLLKSGEYNEHLVEQAMARSHELICMVQPEDDPE